jgi:hypothetical protein
MMGILGQAYPMIGNGGGILQASNSPPLPPRRPSDLGMGLNMDYLQNWLGPGKAEWESQWDKSMGNSPQSDYSGREIPWNPRGNPPTDYRTGQADPGWLFWNALGLTPFRGNI